MPSDAATRLIVAEDNRHYAIALRNNLEIDGFAVDVVHDGVAALARVRERPPALLILDLAMPVRDGYEVLRTLRDEGMNIPVLILTARRDEADKLRGFGLGADDYVTKPVGLLELIARIRAVLRRTLPGFDETPTWIRFGDVEVHPPSRTVRRNGQLVELRPKHFDLLIALLRHQDRVVSRAELLRDVWGYHADTVSRTVDTHIAGLRHVLEADPLDPRFILTVRTAGYMLKRSDTPDR
ncbi:MAG TPA: response regulator transcription factor [Gemmatimonadaceae bacterium]|nr:response regulator transcription factor [Gemmatimonadaceae bacterium]